MAQPAAAKEPALMKPRELQREDRFWQDYAFNGNTFSTADSNRARAVWAESNRRWLSSYLPGGLMYARHVARTGGN